MGSEPILRHSDQRSLGKIVMVYGRVVVSNDQVYRPVGEIPALIARRAPDARCFKGDTAASTPTRRPRVLGKN
jgi:hypothetical protein